LTWPSARLTLVAVISTLLACPGLDAAPVRVRLLEGNARGFLALRSLDGQPIAYGELRQTPRGSLIESRLVLTFADGSLREETTTFSEKGVFRLERYRLVQRGPSLPKAEVAFDRTSGQFRAVTQEKPGGEEKSAAGPVDMPADVYNGMDLVLLKNLPAGTSATVQTVAFLPKPRLIRTVLSAEGEERVRVGGQVVPVTRYLVKLELTGLTGVLASLIGKEPPDRRYWLATGDVPAFLRFQGAMFLNGPVWRLDQSMVEWPK
jgi:hypothetical protein